ncbi:hypothetical protein BQ8482_440010 [Mesorhizobium delmotii]|uniref:Uncharacterized protein n=1 Tax=Mesorhizobium delmotii TaxID=1631247 RepID=A0A2P9ATK9_9HYPH|nr:hypothetical protein BQ8482_440010 [Mesorhizobium delmotii]
MVGDLGVDLEPSAMSLSLGPRTGDVAYASDAGHEKHARRHDPRDILRVVSGGAEHQHAGAGRELLARTLEDQRLLLHGIGHTGAGSDAETTGAAVIRARARRLFKKVESITVLFILFGLNSRQTAAATQISIGEVRSHQFPFEEMAR